MYLAASEWTLGFTSTAATATACGLTALDGSYYGPVLADFAAARIEDRIESRIAARASALVRTLAPAPVITRSLNYPLLKYRRTCVSGASLIPHVRLNR